MRSLENGFAARVCVGRGGPKTAQTERHWPRIKAEPYGRCVREQKQASRAMARDAGKRGVPLKAALTLESRIAAV